jgi:MFS family permease
VGGLRDKAAKWDEHMVKEADNKAKASLAIIFLVLFVLSVLMGLIGKIPAALYTVVAILGLCFAGGFGATVRMINPGAPATRKLTSALLGITVGLVFSLLYMLPQLVGGEGFAIPSEGGITPTHRVQFLSAMLVAFMAGLGFDYAMEQLLRRAKDRGDEIIKPELRASSSHPLVVKLRVNDLRFRPS